jgi:hypothetical protein
MAQTYEIIGGDHRAHGPVSGEELTQWIRQGRASRQTMIRVSGTDAWRPMYTYGEFTGPLQGLPWIPVNQPAPKAHKLAVTSLVLGISSLVFIAAGFMLVPMVLVGVMAAAGRPEHGVLAALISTGLLLLPALPAVVTGHHAMRAIKADPDLHGGNGMALAGVITGYLGLAAGGIIFMLVAWGWVETID